MKLINVQTLKNAFGKKGYAWPTTGPKLVGIRTTLNLPDVFNDVFIAVFNQPPLPATLGVVGVQNFLNLFGYRGKDGQRLKVDGDKGANTIFALDQYNRTVGQERMMAWTCTTVPGVYYLTNPVPGGCAMLVPGQYVGVYQIGLHQQGKPGEQHALVQTGGEVRCYRDNDKDIYAEETDKITKGYYGINIHHAKTGGTSTRIWNWSAGCQVFANDTDHGELMALCNWFKAAVGNRFTYTLLRESEL